MSRICWCGSWQCRGFQALKLLNTASVLELCLAVLEGKESTCLHSADGHGAPATADLQDVVAGLDVCHGYERVQLVQLRLFQAVACSTPRLSPCRTAATHTCLHACMRLFVHASGGMSYIAIVWRIKVDDSAGHTWVVDTRGVGHGGVQEQLVHAIAGVVVLLYVPPAALNLHPTHWQSVSGHTIQPASYKKGNQCQITRGRPKNTYIGTPLL